LDAPITPNYSYPVASQKIGSYIRSDIIITNPITTIGNSVCSVTVPSAGIYIITVNCQFNGSATTLYFSLTFSGTDPLLFNSNLGYTDIIPSSFVGLGNTFMCAPSASGTYTLFVSGIVGSMAVSFATISAVRIA
jgi:hypothetical protein